MSCAPRPRVLDALIALEGGPVEIPREPPHPPLCTSRLRRAVDRLIFGDIAYHTRDERRFRDFVFGDDA